MDVSRAIEPELIPGFPAVTVLEGPRTCGKTYVVQKLVREGVWDGYRTLADLSTLELAQHDLPGWLSSLPTTVVIDEAQLVDELPLQLKRLVDEPGSTRKFLLTGSARIARTGLGGSDPLTGRVRRWSLAPLTAAEIDGRPEQARSLVARLFDTTVAQNADHPALDVAARVNTGGFPLLALAARSTRDADHWVRDTTLGLLTEAVLPDDRFDAGVALRVLDGCLRDPSGILNVTSLGQRLAVDPRTVDRYLDVLTRRFLLHFLPNLAVNPTRQTRARAKVHPVDTAFSSESLRRSDPDATNSPVVMGDLFESYVVNQILPCLQFSDVPVHAFYWRDAKTSKDVDLVLTDTEGRRVGIEVKTSSRVTLTDAAGLHALDASLPLTAAYVVYPGTKTVRLADRCWALPATAL